MRAQFKLARIVFAIVCMTSFVGAASAKPIDPKHFQIVGLTLFKDEMTDVTSKLGEATDEPSRHERCYVSVANDRTVLALEVGTLISFRVYRASPQAKLNCTPNSAVSPQIATEGG